jgi:hypothetical protein
MVVAIEMEISVSGAAIAMAVMGTGPSIGDPIPMPNRFMLHPPCTMSHVDHQASVYFFRLIFVGKTLPFNPSV